MLWLGRLVDGVSPRKSASDLVPVRVRFVAENVALGVFNPSTSASPLSNFTTILHTHLQLHAIRSSGKSGRSLETAERSSGLSDTGDCRTENSFYNSSTWEG